MSFAKNQLLPDEKLIILAHQHYFVLLRPILLNVAALVILAGISYGLNQPWLLLFELVPLVYLGWELLIRRNREYVLTDHRVVKQEGVFSITSFDASLDKVNNVFHEQSVWGRIFKYGDVGLETASEQGTTVFTCVPDPVNFKNSIVRERESYKSHPEAHQTASSREDIPRMIEGLASLRDRRIITDSEYEEKKKVLLGKIS
jgi:uncharacterized membrane protein YdbT with pleckstrin-like domain